MSFLFYFHCLFIFFILLNAIFLVLSKNPVYSVLFLILIFFCSASILVLFGIDFLGILFIIIYVGAIAVLFLFVVMMLDLKQDFLDSKKSFLIFSLVILVCFFSFCLIYFSNFLFFFDKNFIVIYSFNEIIDSFFNLNVFGQCLYNYYLICFLIAGLILLIAMLGAISLTLRYKSIRTNEIYTKQLSRSNIYLSFFK